MSSIPSVDELKNYKFPDVGEFIEYKPPEPKFDEPSYKSNDPEDLIALTEFQTKIKSFDGTLPIERGWSSVPTEHQMNKYYKHPHIGHYLKPPPPPPKQLPSRPSQIVRGTRGGRRSSRRGRKKRRRSTTRKQKQR